MSPKHCLSDEGYLMLNREDLLNTGIYIYIYMYREGGCTLSSRGGVFTKVGGRGRMHGGLPVGCSLVINLGKLFRP